MPPKSFSKRSPALKRALVPAEDIAGAVHERVSPSVAAAFAGTKFAIFVSILSALLSLGALIVALAG